MTRLRGSGQFLNRKKTSPEPPEIYRVPPLTERKDKRTRGTVQVFERQGVQVFDLMRSRSKFVTGTVPVPFRFYADSYKHLHRARFCTVCAVKAWCLVSTFDKKI